MEKPASQATTHVKDYRWAKIFIEIALRAIRRVHYEYGVWGIGHNFVKDPYMAWRINMGMGIEVADEPGVCAAITQEFMNSPTVVGLWLKD